MYTTLTDKTINNIEHTSNIIKSKVIWEVNCDTIMLVHNKFSGKRVILLNDKIIHSSRKLIDNGSTHIITINKNIFYLQIKEYGFGFKYFLNSK